MKDFIDSSAVLPSEQVDFEFVPQSIVRITLRKPKPVEELKAVSFMSSNRSGKTSRLPELDTCVTVKAHEVAWDQSRLDQIEGLFLSSTLQNREGRDLLMSFLGVEPVLDVPEYIFPFRKQHPEEGEIPDGQVAPSAESVAMVVAENVSWGFCDDAPIGRPL